MAVFGVSLLVIGGLFGALAVGFLMRNARLYARMRAAPTPLAACAPGASVVARGVVQCAAPVASPASGRPAVFYDVLVSDWDGDTRHHEQGGCSFWLADGAHARVEPGSSHMFVRRTRYVSATSHESWLRSPTGDQEPPVTIDETSPRVVEWGLARARSAGPLAVREALVAPGERVRILGRARRDPDGTLAFTGAVLCTCEDADLTRMRSEMIRTHVLVLVVGMSIAAVGAAITLWWA